jgi:hypothetical protein
MRLKLFAFGVLVVVGLVAKAAPAIADDRIEITEDVIARFLGAHQAEGAEQEKIAGELTDLDRKIAEWRECAKKFQAAGDATGSRMGGFAARAAMKAKCGASSEDGFLKDREKLMEQPAKVALSAGGFKGRQYETLTSRIVSFLSGVDANLFTEVEKSALAAHRDELLRALGSQVTGSGSSNSGSGAMIGVGGGRGHLPATWAGDAAWGYIGYMYGVMYLSGANAFEKPYNQGEWTRWQMSDSDTPDEKTIIERAFLGSTPEAGQWWRTKSIITTEAGVDTVTLEALFKPLDPEWNTRQLVRMRGWLPGDKEPREMMVPQYLSMLTGNAALPFGPTPESVEGATVGTEMVGGVSARHVRYAGGAGGATIEWWLSEGVPGGWVKFIGTGGNSGGEKPSTWTLEMVGSGAGAKSELGVM